MTVMTATFILGGKTYYLCTETERVGSTHLS